MFQEVLHTPNGVNPPVPHNGGENPLTFFWGWDKPGNWLKGKYTVDIDLGSRRPERKLYYHRPRAEIRKPL